MTSKIRIKAITVLTDQHLAITWQNDKQHTVSLHDFITQFVVLKPLLDAARFQQAQVGEWGLDVAWGDDVEIAATTLYRLALEQTGEVMPMNNFKHWMLTNGLSLTTAAQALGLSRRTVTAYSSGTALIPKHIGLACKGWDSLHRVA